LTIVRRPKIKNCYGLGVMCVVYSTNL
jgi:hypothetical protein